MGFSSPQAIQAAAPFPFGLKILLLMGSNNLHVVERLVRSLRQQDHTSAAPGLEGIALSSPGFWKPEWE